MLHVFEVINDVQPKKKRVIPNTSKLFVIMFTFVVRSVYNFCHQQSPYYIGL